MARKELKKITTINDNDPIQVESAIRDGIGDNIEDNYAKQNGYYETMTVGSADNLTPYSDSSGATGTNAFTMQTTGGSADVSDVAHLKALRGNSLYSLVGDETNVEKRGFYTTWNGFGKKSFGNGNSITRLNLALLKNHTYLIYVKCSGVNLATDLATNMNLVYSNSSTVDLGVATKIGDTYLWTKTITATNVLSFLGGYYMITEEQYNAINISYWGIIDLTALNLSGLSTTGECFKFFGEKELQYLASKDDISFPKSSKIVNMGCNAYDNANPTDYIKVIRGETYVISGTYTSVELYDVNKELLEDEYEDEEPLPLDCQYVKIIGGSTDTMFRLSWDETHDYVPYEKHEYNLPNVELRSAGSVYDELKPDGKLIRRVGVVDLGTLTWSYNSTSSHERMSSVTLINSYKKPSSNDEVANILCAKFVSATFTQTTNHTVANSIAIRNDGTLEVYSSTMGTDASAFKTAMSGVMLYYELATPTEEQVSGYQEIQQIDDFGTQEFLYDSDIDIPVPQGNEFFYPVDYKAFIDSLGGREDIEYSADSIVSQTQLANYLKTISGYNATKTQTLKNVNGTFTWVDD